MDPQNRERAFWLVLVALLGGFALYQYATRPVTRFTVPNLNAEEVATVAAFHELSYFNTDTWRKNTWLGVPAQQNPNDAWIIQEILHEVKPDVLLEAGTAEGGKSEVSRIVDALYGDDLQCLAHCVVDHVDDRCRRRPDIDAQGGSKFLGNGSVGCFEVDRQFSREQR